MAGVPIGWNEGTPADADNLAAGAGAIRSVLTNVRGGLAAEHVWPAAGGTAGAHLAGSARPFYGAASAVSSSDTDGRLMVSSDNTRLWHTGSGSVFPLGGVGMLSCASVPSYFTNFEWRASFGTGTTGIAGGNFGLQTVTFPSAYSSAPMVWLTAAPTITGALGGFLVARNILNTQFQASSYGTSGSTLGAVDYNWFSIGTVPIR